MTMLFYDLSASHEEIQDELDSAWRDVVASGHFIMGRELEAFEAEFAAYCGTKHCIGLSNGLEALELALRAMDIGPGDEVIVPAHTFVATWLAVSNVGATPVGVEVNRATYTLDADAVAAAITPRTRCIIPVHLYGLPADMGPINALAAKHGLTVLEDAAQAHGATLDGRRIGGFGTMAAFSFYPTKNLGALGDGGAIVTNDDQLAQRIRLLRNYGSERKYEHKLKGRNARLDELQAAILRVKLRHLDRWNEARRHLAAHYSRTLAGIPGIVVPVERRGAKSVWHLFVVQVREQRDELMKFLNQRGIATLVHYPIPPHRQEAYAQDGYVSAHFPVSEALAREVLSLPFWPQMTVAQADFVAEAIRQWSDGRV